MDSIRQLIIEPEKKNFKTTLFGLEKNQVFEYISAMEESNKKAIENYEKNNEEQSSSLAMITREKEKLETRVSELKAEVKRLNPENDETKSKLIAQNEQLKNEIETLKEYKFEIDELKTQLKAFETECDFLNSERQKYEESIKEKEDTIMEQCKQIAEMQKKHKFEISTMNVNAEAEKGILNHNIRILKEHLAKAETILQGFN
ncbi:MAG: hypothetical protein PHE51_07855 [Eubacteriales bacterium]|nr:hypothetical protein [Eubacteriales bacterium]